MKKLTLLVIILLVSLIGYSQKFIYNVNSYRLMKYKNGEPNGSVIYAPKKTFIIQDGTNNTFSISGENFSKPIIGYNGKFISKTTKDEYDSYLVRYDVDGWGYMMVSEVFPKEGEVYFLVGFVTNGKIVGGLRLNYDQY